MASFLWIDHSEKQRRQVLEAIDQFREKDTRDELGTAGIRDAFADLLFPGTGALQTRARYFLFIPWMYRQMETRKVPSSEVAARAKQYETQLIDALVESEDNRGTIGKEARATLQRRPSSIYWNALKTLRICEFRGSQADYHRSLDRFYQAQGQRRVADDDEPVGPRVGHWDADLPPAPEGLPKVASFALSRQEAEYLREMVRINHPRSLFAFILERAVPEPDVSFVWELAMVKDSGAELSRQLEHARCFSEVRQGAAILYNLLLAEMEPIRQDTIEACHQLWDGWVVMMASRRDAHRAWRLDDFWRLLDEQSRPARRPTRDFVEAWYRLVVDEAPDRARDSGVSRELIKARERTTKGALARVDNRRAREMWRGESGLGQLDYRWSDALVVIRDIQRVLGGGRA